MPFLIKKCKFFKTNSKKQFSVSGNQELLWTEVL